MGGVEGSKDGEVRTDVMDFSNPIIGRNPPT
jgi:hypothetical protein